MGTVTALAALLEIKPTGTGSNSMSVKVRSFKEVRVRAKSTLTLQGKNNQYATVSKGADVHHESHWAELVRCADFSAKEHPRHEQVTYFRQALLSNFIGQYFGRLDALVQTKSAVQTPSNSRQADGLPQSPQTVLRNISTRL